MKLTDRTILITGGTSGIGRTLAEALHRRGNQVIIAGRRQALLDEITAANPGMYGVRVDMRDPASIASLAEEVRARFPDLDVLVNNAGISRAEDWSGDTIDIESSLAMVETNVLGTIRLTAALLPTLARQAFATIITTTSGLAFVPRSEFLTYCATKAFLHSWLQSLRHQLRHTSIEVLELAPPYVRTELTGPHQARDPAAMPLEEFTAEVVALLEKPAPADGEILVERVKPLRTAERSGTYAQIYGHMNPP